MSPIGVFGTLKAVFSPEYEVVHYRCDDGDLDPVEPP
jgi:hypothetical protein